MDLYVAATLLIRGANLALWLWLGWRIIKDDRPVSTIARRLITLMAVTGMGVLFIGALVPLGFPGDAAKFIYTSYTAATAIVALTLLSVGEPQS